MSLAPKQRIVELDSLRGLAALSVMLFHYTTRFGQLYGHPLKLFDFPQGAYGVQLFFLISGFVIIMTIERTKNVTEFLISRFSRLFPSYWLAVALTYALVKLLSLPGLGVGIKNAVLNLTMLQAFLGIPNVDGVYWTLEVELVFYVVMAVIIWRKKINSIEKISLAGLSMSIGFYYILSSQFGKNIDSLSIIPLFLKYLNLFIAGMSFFHLRKKKNVILNRLLILFSLLTQFIISNFPENLIVTGFFAIFYLLSTRRLKILIVPALISLGSISYPLYLTHEFMGYIIIRELYSSQANSYLLLITPVLIALLVATLIHRSIEVPGQKFLKTRLSSIRGPFL